VGQIDLKITELQVGKPITMVVHPKDGKPFDIKLSHTFNEGQIEWLRAGSALNVRAPIDSPNVARFMLTSSQAMAKAHQS
jgi:aconitate hydratase